MTNASANTAALCRCFYTTRPKRRGKRGRADHEPCIDLPAPALQRQNILPPYDLLVVDEAHKLPDYARGRWVWR